MNPSGRKIPEIAQNLSAADLVSAINDRFRRLTTPASTTAAASTAAATSLDHYVANSSGILVLSNVMQLVPGLTITVSPGGWFLIECTLLIQLIGGDRVSGVLTVNGTVEATRSLSLTAAGNVSPQISQSWILQLADRTQLQITADRPAGAGASDVQSGGLTAVRIGASS